jgi:hypothetical protein
MKTDSYFVDNDKTISPDMRTAANRKLPFARVMQKSPPFALGCVVAYFVGADQDEADRMAAEYVELKNRAE